MTNQSKITMRRDDLPPGVPPAEELEVEMPPLAAIVVLAVLAVLALAIGEGMARQHHEDCARGELRGENVCPRAAAYDGEHGSGGRWRWEIEEGK